MNPLRNAILLFVILGLYFPASAQISIGSADLPQAGVTYDVVNTAVTDFNLTTIDGANATWDASGLIPLGDAPISPVDINDASITAALVFNSPFNSAYQCDYYLPTVFPDLGVELPIPLDGFNNFYQTDGGHFAIAGIGLSASGFDEFFPIPFSFEQSFESTAAFELNLEGILSYGLDQTRAVIADAWGTLVLPGGSFEVLRTRTQLNATDNIYIEQLGEPFELERDQVIYQWWGAGTGVPLLEITEIFGTPALANFQNIGGSNEITPFESAEFSIHPNPISSGQALMIGTAPRSYSIHDAQGRRISSGKSSRVEVPSHWSAGNYTIVISGTAQRFIIQ